jgi:hypothetical protein
MSCDETSHRQVPSQGKAWGRVEERVAQWAQVGPTTWEVRARPHQVEFEVPQSGNVNRTSLRLVTREMTSVLDVVRRPLLGRPRAPAHPHRPVYRCLVFEAINYLVQFG